MLSRNSKILILVLLIIIDSLLYLNMIKPGSLQESPEISDEVTGFITNVKIFTVKGSSMAPALSSGSKVNVDLNYYNYHGIERGDIIALKFKTRKDPLVKRVIAIQGDNVVIENNGDILINEELDSFGKIRTSRSILSIQLSRMDSTIPQNTYLVLGDNRRSSIDSEEYGLVSRTQIIGKVISDD